MKNLRTFTFIVLIILFTTSVGYALVGKVDRPTIGLALGEGGIRGLVHVGAMKVLLENGYHIDYIAGTSIGSMVGGLYAFWNNIDKVEDFMLNLNFDDFMKAGTNNLKFKKFGDNAYLTLYFDLLNKRTKLSLLSGLISSTKIRDGIDKITNRASIEYDLSIPYKAIACDLISGKKVVIGSGRLSNAIAGSICVPGFFAPLRYGNMYLIDGGIKDPVPVDIVRDMGADIVIAIALRGISDDKGITIDNVVSIIERSMFIMVEDKTKESVKGADILLAPKLKVKSLSYSISKEERMRLIKLGEDLMRKKLPLLKEKIEEKSKK